MQTIEFETTAFQHTVRIPDDVPDGVLVRIVLSFDDTKIQNDSNNKHGENLPGTMPNVGSDEAVVRTSKAKRQAALAHIAATQVDWQGKPIIDRDVMYDESRD